MPSPVLLNVDDHAAALYARSRLLRKAGFRVEEATSGEQALELVPSLKPDLILLDVHLPGIDGIQVCRTIKSDPDSASIIVLQISASAISAPQATHALNSGADAYLTEPVDPDVLVATVRALLRLRKVERELDETNVALREANLRLKETNRALERSNEDLEHFAHIASHDLQEPLRTLTTHVQLLDRSFTGTLDPSQSELFSFVVEAARRMSSLIDDVLRYSRAGRSNRSFSPVRLNDTLQWAIQNLGQSISTADAEITAGPLPTVWGDWVQLAQLMQNLVGNAIKYRAPDRSVQVHVSSEEAADGQWIISVADNGMGIEAEYQEQIFGPFKRLHGADIPGTGIGLALCRRIVEGHGGRIWVESEAGRGSTFRFTLDAASVEVQGTATRA